jgi:hypothetical protein
MIVETIVGLSAIYLLAKAEKPQAKTMVKAKAPALSEAPAEKTMPTSMAEVIEQAKQAPKVSDVPLVKTTFADVTLENMIAPEVSFPKPATGTRTLEGDLVIEKDVLDKKVAEKFLKEPPMHLMTNGNQLGFYRFFKTPEARAFAAKMQTIGFGKTLADTDLNKWDKFFFWLRFDEMPDMNTAIEQYSSSERKQVLIQEAEARGLFTDAAFERLKAYLAPKKGSSTTITQSVADAKAEYQRQAEAQAAAQAAAAKAAEEKRVRDRDAMLAEQKASAQASTLAKYTQQLELLRKGSWEQVRDAIYTEWRSALTSSAFTRRMQETPIVGGSTTNLPNGLVMPEGYAFLPEGKRFAYFTNPEGTIYYATMVYAIPGRVGDPIIAGRVVSKEEYNKAKALLGQ